MLCFIGMVCNKLISGADFFVPAAANSAITAAPVDSTTDLAYKTDFLRFGAPAAGMAGQQLFIFGFAQLVG